MAQDDSTKIAEAKANAEAVETGKPADEASEETEDNKGDENTEETNAEDKSEEKDDDSAKADDAPISPDGDEDKSGGTEITFKKRFTQFKGDTPEEYQQSLEEGYANSSTEAQRLAAKNKELEQKVQQFDKLLSDNPDLADKVKDEGGQPIDPTAQVLRQQVEDQWHNEYNEFVKEHPEVQNDEKVASDLNEALAIVRDHVWKTEGKIVSMERGLKMAWKLINKEEEVDTSRQIAKDVASQGRPTGGKKPVSTGGLNESQRSVAEKMGLDPSKVAKNIRKA